MKKKKMITMLIKELRHDFGFYNSVFKWEAFPSPIDTSFEFLLPILKQWEEQGLIKLFKKDGEQMIQVIKPPSFEQTIQINNDKFKNR